MGSSQISNSAGEDLKPDAAPAEVWAGRTTFRARRWLRGGHVQTIASFLLPRRIHLPPAEERLVEVEAGVVGKAIVDKTIVDKAIIDKAIKDVTIQLRCLCYWQPERTQPLTLIVVHGLEGSSDSQYMQGIARDGIAAGMNVVLMNQRNCGGMDHVAPTLYNSSLSGDVAAVVRNVLENDKVSRFALIGFSMGGNLVLKLAGEWGGDGPRQFRAVAAVCPAIDLAASADALHRPANRIYEYYFLLQLFRRLRLKARLFPKKFDVARLRGISSLRMFDDRITAHYCGFAGADDYYARAAAANVVDRIAVPTLIIHAANDPFIRITPETLRRIVANPNITYVETEDGGHCAFLGASDGEGNGRAAHDGRWAEREVLEFVAAQ